MPETTTSDPIEIPPLTGIYAEPFSLGKLWRLMGFFGPAAVVASLSLGAGETIMATGLGAWSEYGLLWVLMLSVVVKGIFVTYLVGRYTAVTGQPIGHRLVMLPGPRGWLLLAIVVAEVGLISMGLTAVSKPCGNLMTNLMFERFSAGISFGTWENLWTTALLVAAMVSGLFVSYQVLERQQIVICGIMIVGTIAATVIVRPDFGKLVVGALSIGHLPPAPEWAPPAAQHNYLLNLMTIFGYVGGSLSGYLAYSSWIAMSGWGLNAHPDIDQIRLRAGAGPRIDYLPDDPQQAQRLRVLLTPLRWDVGMGALVLFVVTASFVAAGATVLFPKQQAIGGNAWELLTKQADIWRQLNETLVPVYYVVILAALWGTVASVPEAITRMTHEFLSAIWPSFERFPIRRLQCLLVAWFLATSIAWTWSGVSFDKLTQAGAFVTVSLGLSAVFICVLYFNFTLPPLYRPRWWMLAGGVVSAAVLLLCTVGAAYEQLTKLLQKS